MRRWFLGTIAICLALIGVEAAVSTAIQAAASRDIGWVPGPWAGVEDFLFQWHWAIALLVLLLAETPAVWWRRLGGSAMGVLGIAFICPVAVFGPALAPKGYSEDSFVLVAGTIFILFLAVAASTLIMVFVRPVMDTAQYPGD
jgi:hypothetical protein